MDEVDAWTGVQRLHARYGDAVTRRSWDEVAACFVEGAVVRLDLRGDAGVRTFDGGEAIASFIASSVERFDLFVFVPLNAVVDGDGSARLYIQELRHETASGRWTTAYGLYVDRCRRDPDDGEWRFVEREYSSLARTAAAGDDMEVFGLPGAS